MIRNEIKSGVNFTAIEGKYKKSRLSVSLISPISRDIITQTALLPYMLERGTEKCPDMTAIKRKLNALYGTDMSTSYASSGFSRLIECVMSGADGSLLEDGEEISAERARLLLDILLDPHMENNCFCEEWIDIEREKLRETINSIINDKATYCFKLLNEEFFKGDERALPPDGFAEDLDKITASDLTEVYRQFISRSEVEIVYVGPDTERFSDIASAAAPRFVSAAAVRKGIVPVAKNSSEVRVIKELDVEQDKLAFAYTTGKVLNRQEHTILRIATALLGGTPTSRLFQNVREKQSLCYSVSASPSFDSGGGMYVECGVEHRNAEHTREAVAHELASLIKNGPRADELEQVKLLYQNVYHGIYDSTASIAKYEFNSIIRFGELTDPQEEFKAIQSVTSEEIIEMLASLTLNCSCQLCKKEGA
ncbi:MAG: pitrilysin family protein [Oscillospiraceae bacterium]